MPQKPKLYLKITVFTIVVIGILGYAYSRVINLIEGPTIHIEKPARGAVIDTSALLLSGSAHNVTELTLNGRPIFIDQQDRFSEEILVNEGYSVVQFTAKDKFGKETRKTFEVVYEKPL